MVIKLWASSVLLSMLLKLLLSLQLYTIYNTFTLLYFVFLQNLFRIRFSQFLFRYSFRIYHLILKVSKFTFVDFLKIELAI